MWRPLSKCLELFGRLRIPIPRGRLRLSVGDAAARDAAGTFDWRTYETAASLYDAWGPLPGSPWASYHCVTLFAALERIPNLGPTAVAEAARIEGPLPSGELPPPWASPGAFILVDLPGPQSHDSGASSHRERQRWGLVRGPVRAAARSFAALAAQGDQRAVHQLGIVDRRDVHGAGHPTSPVCKRIANRHDGSTTPAIPATPAEALPQTRPTAPPTPYSPIRSAKLHYNRLSQNAGDEGERLASGAGAGRGGLAV